MQYLSRSIGNIEQIIDTDPPLEDSELAKIWHSAARTTQWAREQPGYVPPEQFNAIGSLKPDDYSDIGQAKVIAAECAGELAFTPATGFIRFTGKHWEESQTKALSLVIGLLDRQLEDAEACVQRAQEQLVKLGISPDAIASGGKALEKQIEAKQADAYYALLGAQAYRQFTMKRRDLKYILSAMQAARPMVEIDANELDKNENYLNCPDGTYDISLGLFGRHDHLPEDLITKITASAPGEEGQELWQDTLEKIFRGDRELIEYVQRIVGLAAIGEVYQEAMIIAYGDGSNGKSTFWNTIAAVMGTYAGVISADALTVNC